MQRQRVLIVATQCDGPVGVIAGQLELQGGGGRVGRVTIVRRADVQSEAATQCGEVGSEVQQESARDYQQQDE